MATRIVKQTPDHAGGLFTALSDPRIYSHLDDGPPESASSLRARLQRLQVGGPEDGSERWLNWTVFHDDQIVGYVQATLFPDRSASIAYVLTPEVWGRGIAFAAVRAMLAELLRDKAPVRFLADAERQNIRSHRLLERLGFRQVRVGGNDVFYAAEPGAIGRVVQAEPR